MVYSKDSVHQPKTWNDIYKKFFSLTPRYLISLLAISNRRGAQGQLRSKTKAIALVVSGIAVEIFFEHSLLTLKKTPLCDNPLANFSFSIKKKNQEILEEQVRTF